MAKEFEGKVVIITGAGSGIGKATAASFAALGAHLVLSDINQENLEKSAREIKSQTGAQVATLVADVSNPEHNTALVNLAITTFGKLDILVNNAGIGMQNDIHSSNLMADFDRIFGINVRGMLSLTHESVPHLIKTGGNIVNVSSAASFLSTHQMLVYCMSKAAVTRFTRSLAAELGPDSVRVNEVNPAFTETNIFSADFNYSPDQVKAIFESAAKIMPSGKICSAQDIANSILFLASNDKAALVTGHSLAIDGGLIQRQVKM